MNKHLLIYCAVVALFFGTILFLVRYIVNTTRVVVDYENSISTTEIFWNIDSNDSILRITEPVYVTKHYYLIDLQKQKYKDDSLIMAELFKDSVPNPGSVLNLKPPFILWKGEKNDTIKVFKNEKTLKFVKRNQSAFLK